MSTHMSLTFLPSDKKANKPNGRFTHKSDFALSKSVLLISCTLLGSMAGTTTDKVILLIVVMAKEPRKAQGEDTLNM
jgi:hypothetical protein